MFGEKFLSLPASRNILRNYGRFVYYCVLLRKIQEIMSKITKYCRIRDLHCLSFTRDCAQDGAGIIIWWIWMKSHVKGNYFSSFFWGVRGSSYLRKSYWNLFCYINLLLHVTMSFCIMETIKTKSSQVTEKVIYEHPPSQLSYINTESREQTKMVST